ncbi:MAG: nucleotide pyrophosphohydrolase [Saprospiraceae bacterium]|nr:nucleotide pyrophosphohydrolase [Saprospiraceae bacterium]
MQLKQYQQEVDRWIRSHGVRYFNELTNTVLLMEETGEFARLVARVYGEQSFKTGKDPVDPKQQIADEMADILFVLTCLANQMDIDLTQSVRANLAKKTLRDHQRHKQNDKLTDQLDEEERG